MMKIAIATERSDLHRLAYSAIRAAGSHTVSDDERCFDILRYMKSLNLSVKDLCHSNAILPLASLRNHENPKICMEANVLFNSWMKTLYSSGRNSSTCDKAIPLKLKKVVKVCPELKKKEDERPQTKKQPTLPRKVSENPRTETHETRVIKKTLKKSAGVCKSVLTTSRPLQMRKQTPLKDSQQNPKYCPALKKKKNSTEMLELFEIAKKSADVANAKGILAAKAEASICVDTLSLLMDFSISSVATETRRIMERLERLTKHKDRKICHSASALLHHWKQSIRDQQH